MKEEGRGDGLGLHGHFGEGVDELFLRLFRPHRRGLIDHLLERVGVFGLVSGVVEVERSGAEAGDAGVLLEQGDLIGRALFHDGAEGFAQRLAHGLVAFREFLFEDFGDEGFLLHEAGVIDLLCFALDGIGGGLLFLGLERDEAAGGLAPVLRIKAGLEDGAEFVVVLLRDGIVAVIVAFGALDRHAVEGGADDFERVDDGGIAGEEGVLGAGSVGSHAEETGGGDEFGVASLFGIGRCVRMQAQLRGDLVAGDLFTHEFIKGFVGIERLDHIVAELPGVLPLGVLLVEALGIGVAGDIEPVAAPAFAVLGRVEELGNQESVIGNRISSTVHR